MQSKKHDIPDPLVETWASPRIPHGNTVKSGLGLLKRQKERVVSL